MPYQPPTAEEIARARAALNRVDGERVVVQPGEYATCEIDGAVIPPGAVAWKRVSHGYGGPGEMAGIVQHGTEYRYLCAAHAAARQQRAAQP